VDSKTAVRARLNAFAWAATLRNEIRSSQKAKNYSKVPVPVPFASDCLKSFLRICSSFCL
jgi:hypothetical protein